MKTLAEFKRSVKVGMKFRCTDHWLPLFIGTVRTVTKVQGNGVFYELDGDVKDRRWMPYIASGCTQFNGDKVRFDLGAREASPQNDADHRYWELELISGKEGE